MLHKHIEPERNVYPSFQQYIYQYLQAMYNIWNRKFIDEVNLIKFIVKNARIGMLRIMFEVSIQSNYSMSDITFTESRNQFSRKTLQWQRWQKWEQAWQNVCKAYQIGVRT